MGHWLFLPTDAIDDLEIVSQLPSEKIARLRNLLDSDEFRLRYKFYVKVADELGLPDEAAARLCTFVNYVQTQRKRTDQAASTVIDELKLFLKRHPKSRERTSPIEANIEAKRDFLGGLFGQLPRQEFFEKRRGLETGPLPHLVDVKTYCDLRPIYDHDATNVLEIFPVVILQIVTHCEASDETKEVLVQLSDSDIKDIKEKIDRLERKLEKLEKHRLIAALNSKVKA